jgi:hypothetical protein
MDLAVTGARRLADFAEDARSSSVSLFQDLHGKAFLFHLGSVEDLRAPARPMQTMSGELAVESPLTRVREEFLVFPVKRSGRGPSPGMISVGRTKNNDIYIPDVSLSKFHAFFTERDTVFWLQDAGSRNGTLVNKAPVPARDQGGAVELHSTDRLAFGAVLFAFYYADAFREVVLDFFA